MRTVLICQHDAPLAFEGMARWLASFSTLTGIVLLQDSPGGRWKRIRREARRSGWPRLVDIAAFRLYQRLFLDAADRDFARRKLDELCAKYAPAPEDVPTLECFSPNAAPCLDFIQQARPDIVIAACKHILKPAVFAIPTTGAFALHPGICPEYRNAHGCFWALANDDLQNVGTTLLKIDAGIDTGPIYGYFRGSYDEVRESHAVIQRRMTFDHLDAISEKLIQIHSGLAVPLAVTGRPSAVWGQPWLTKYLRWKRRARLRAARNHAAPASACATASNS